MFYTIAILGIIIALIFGMLVSLKVDTNDNDE